MKRLAAGEISEAMALEKIRESQRRVAQVNELLQQAGGTNAKRPLSKRCEKAMAEPLDPSSEQAAVDLRSRLTLAMQELDAFLDQEFRLTPSSMSPAAGTAP